MDVGEGVVQGERAAAAAAVAVASCCRGSAVVADKFEGIIRQVLCQVVNVQRPLHHIPVLVEDAVEVAQQETAGSPPER